MSKKKSFAVLGLGIFGSTVAKALAQTGQDVIAIDQLQSEVDRIAQYGVNAYVADFTEFETLKAIGLQDVDVAIVAVGSRLEDSIMAVMNLKELNVPHVIAKAMNRKYMDVLLKVGADRVIRPEKEMGERVAKQLSSDGIVDLIEIDSEYNVIEIKAPKSFVGKNLIEIDARRKYGINVLGVRNEMGKLDVSIDPHDVINEKDTLLFIMTNEEFKDLKLD